MTRLFVRLAFLGAFAVASAACSSGSGGPLPFAGPPNTAGGSAGIISTGATSTALLRFVAGSPDFASVDVCVDNVPFNVNAAGVAYGTASSLYAVSGGVAHTIAVYPPLTGASGPPGLECPTAPGPYFGSSAIAITTIAPGTTGNPARETIVLSGTAASKTRALYVFGEPSFATAPASAEAISHNAAAAFSATTPLKSVGFGDVVAGVPANLAGASNVGAPAASPATAAVVNAPVTSTIAGPPVSFFDGIGLASGTVVPIRTVAAPGAVAGQPYAIELYAIDAAAGSLGLVVVPEQTTGFGF